MTPVSSRARKLSKRLAALPKPRAISASSPSLFTNGRLCRATGAKKSPRCLACRSMSFGRTSSASARCGSATTGQANGKRGVRSMPTPTPPAPPQRKWNDEQRQAVKALLAKGATGGVVARAMSITRNQAIGRIRRDPEMELRGFLRKPKVNRTPSSPPQPKAPRPARQNVVTVAAVGDIQPLPTTPVVPAKPEPKDHCHAMALIGTGRRWCKWPVATDSRVLGGFLCCGDHTLPQDVYCSKHRRLAIQPRPVRP